MSIELINDTNLKFSFHYGNPIEFDLIYADMIYEDTNLYWIDMWWKRLKPNGIFIIQTDWHTDFLVRSYIENHELISAYFVNHLVWKNEWGNHPKDRFHQCYDSILIYSNGYPYKFNSEVIQVPKATAKTKLNPSGRETKTATCWIDDVCLTTTSKERIKKEDGHLIKWQKPIKLMDRIISPFTDEEDSIADIFMGSGTLGEWCIRNNRNYVGFEIDKTVFELAKKRLESI
jgi:DNA modification methylase